MLPCQHLCDIDARILSIKDLQCPHTQQHTTTYAKSHIIDLDNKTLWVTHVHMCVI